MTSEYSLKLLLSLAGALVAVAFLVASAAMNYQFSGSLGRTSFEAAIYGAVSVLAVMCNGLCPFFLSWEWEDRRYLVVLAAGTLWSLCLIYSLSSALGFAAENRNDAISARMAAAANYEAALSRLAELTKTRAQYQHPPRQLDDRIDQTRNEVAKLRAAGGARDVDPQAQLISQITFGLIAKHQVRIALVALFAVMVEAGAALGLFAALAHLPRRAAKEILPPLATTEISTSIAATSEPQPARVPTSSGRWLPPTPHGKGSKPARFPVFSYTSCAPSWPAGPPSCSPAPE
jgi:hypothetical protein